MQILVCSRAADRKMMQKLINVHAEQRCLREQNLIAKIVLPISLKVGAMVETIKNSLANNLPGGKFNKTFSLR